MKSKGSSLTPVQALEKLDALYEQSVQALRSAIGKYIETGNFPISPPGVKVFLFIHRFLLPGMAMPQSPENPCLWALYSCGLLYHDHHPSGTVPPLSGRTAHAVVSGLRRTDHRRALTA